jgi:hypothetical protein
MISGVGAHRFCKTRIRGSSGVIHLHIYFQLLVESKSRHQVVGFVEKSFDVVVPAAEIFWSNSSAKKISSIPNVV